MLITEKNGNKNDHKYCKDRTKGKNEWKIQGCIFQLNAEDNFFINGALQKCRVS